MSNAKGREYLSLKWGGVKGWDNLTEASVKLLEEYERGGNNSSGVMSDRLDKTRKEILIKLIDQLDGVIWQDWYCREMTKEEAKSYINTY